ncbi:MAG: hypothetical protein Q8922_06430 [Bacteroidota bacterium]|nr:hypothetical protein [Bacteroidota bacterium]MDP4233795.1 hypothetical protein [Bacteroidota bacterium]MDP4242434.1 hypothetical protein [Bacteroidota bacterium]MDP4287556.1 hypothetical protein [Bacteroidota bacterium]
MIAFILLKGKDFVIPDGISVGIIGMFFGLIMGLFYYQHYLKPWFWAISLVAGALFTSFFHWVFLRRPSSDDSTSLVLTIASFIVPFALTLALNQTLYVLKVRKRKQRSGRKRHSSFFDTVNAADALKRERDVTSL